MQPAQKAYLESLTFIDTGLSILVGLAYLTGAVLFFLLRKQAFYLFVFAFVANVLGAVWHIGSIIAIKHSGGLIGTLIELVALFAVCVYIKKLEKAGVLR